MLLLVVTAMSQYIHAGLIDKGPRFLCTFFDQYFIINCCTPMDLDGDGKINDILISCMESYLYPEDYYVYAELIRRNETWCKKTWNHAFDSNYTFSALADYKLLDPC